MFRVASIRWYVHIQESERSLRSIHPTEWEPRAYGSSKPKNVPKWKAEDECVCINAGVSLSLSRESFAPHLSRFFLLDAFIHKRHLHNGVQCKEMRRRKSFNKYTSSCCWYYMQEWECTRRMQPNGISLSLSIPHALDNFNQHTHADEIKESDQCIFFMIHFLFLWDCMFTQFPF